MMKGTEMNDFRRIEWHPARRFQNLGIWVCLAALVLSTGCHKQFWRHQANQEVQCLMSEKAPATNISLNDYRFEASPNSRFYLPYDRDAQPMPQDDPTTHTIMQCVYGKRGWSKWTRNGVIRSVENPNWESALPHDANGQVLLNRETVMDIALINSPEYRTQMENIYLSALDVTLQRYSFDAHYGMYMDGDYRTSFHGTGTAGTTVGADISKISATGGTFAADVANSIVWTFGGGDTTKVHSTLLNMTLTQQLLRRAGRAYVLESLTSSERGFIMDIRAMERYRQEFYIQTITGGNGLGGLYALIYQQLQLANQRQNVSDLRDSTDRMDALCDAGRIERNQVDQTRQSLLDAQLNLLNTEDSYKAQLDSYKIQLGLPPALNAVVEDDILEPFILMSPEVAQMREQISDIQQKLRDSQLTEADTAAQMGIMVQQSADFCGNIDTDYNHLLKVLPERVASLKWMMSQEEFLNGNIDHTAVDPEVFIDRVKEIREDYIAFKKQLNVLARELNALAAGTAIAAPGEEGMTELEMLDIWMDKFGSHLLQMSLIQARIRLDSIMLVPVELEEMNSLQIARENRLDWMNERTKLVDQWRQIELRANMLKSDLSVTANGRVDLENAHTNSSLSLGVQFDAPLDRKSERNAYVSTLISYDRARREFIHFEDTIHQSIRKLVRDVKLAQMNFELRRLAVLVAMRRVDQANMQLLQPPKPNQTSQFGDSFARELTNALNTLLSSQNSFIREWITFEASRMEIELTLGTFRLDTRGRWIDGRSSTAVSNLSVTSQPAQPAVLTRAATRFPEGEELE